LECSMRWNSPEVFWKSSERHRLESSASSPGKTLEVPCRPY
jgi:hypothetical protein